MMNFLPENSRYLEEKRIEQNQEILRVVYWRILRGLVVGAFMLSFLKLIGG
jgi:hypothetical protein